MTTSHKTLYLTFFLLLAMWFYWYQYRPSQIRSECAKIQKDILVDELDKNRSLSNQEEVIQVTKDLYTICINERGLTK